MFDKEEVNRALKNVRLRPIGPALFEFGPAICSCGAHLSAGSGKPEIVTDFLSYWIASHVGPGHEIQAI